MRSSNKIFLTLFICAAALFLYSCSGINDTHQEIAEKYAEVGETIYIGKLDSLKFFPGKERVKLRYWVSDSRASKLLIYWASRTDSLVLDIPTNPPGDSVDADISLPEGTYSFEMLTMDEDSEDRSIPVEVTAEVYGQEYQESLSNRPVNFVGIDIGNDNQLTINWFKAVGSPIGTEVQYKDKQGETKSVFVPVGEEQNSVENFDGGLQYRTVFLPEPTAIDTFYTDYVSIFLEDYLPFEEQIDPAPFGRWNPPGIPYSQFSSFGIENLWNGVTFNDFFIFNGEPLYTEFPFIFTFDLGQLVKLDSLRYHQRIREQHDLMYTHAQNIESFSIWGAADSTGLNEDYSSGWQKIGDFTIEKPSGLPLGELSAEDIQTAIEGHDFVIDPNAPEVRYIRFEVTGKWVGNPDPLTALGELQFWGTHAYFTN